MSGVWNLGTAPTSDDLDAANPEHEESGSDVSTDFSSSFVAGIRDGIVADWHPRNAERTGHHTDIQARGHFVAH